MKKVLITTVPFGNVNRFPLDLLEASNIEYVINPHNRKLSEEELYNLIDEYDAVIAGTEPISERIITKSGNLKLISRVGIGLDGLDLNAARNNNVKVAYTPDAPAPAVAELTLGLMLNLLRSISLSNNDLHNGSWNRYFGKRIPEITIGIIGAGRIGGRVIRRLSAFGSPRMLVNDRMITNVTDKIKIEHVGKETIYKEADLISLHIPLTPSTKNLISENELKLMKSDALLINTSRGGIINEDALYNALKNNKIGGAAIDVFVDEPYKGKLSELPNCILTAHMGSMSLDCRVQMEIQATEEVVRFFNGEELKNPVPDFEYKLQ